MLYRHFILITALIFLSGCSTIGYYSQSVQGHMQVWWPQKPAEELIAQPETDATLRQRLRTALQIRQFASRQLKLPDNGSYTGYTDLGRPHVLWNVVAAPEFSLTPKKWCYLVVGCVSYRGYFNQQEARGYATRLQEQGFDVSVGGVTAYSTLGWFDDPLLNTMMKWSDRRLAGLIFHELAHQVVYVRHDTSFNEAFASAVERMGSLIWLTSHKTAAKDYLAYLKQKAEFRRMLMATRDQLLSLYATDMAEERKRQEKARILTELAERHAQQKRAWPQPHAFDYWFQQPINNARLTASMTYLEKIPAFYALFAASEGDWQTFYKAVRDMENLSQQQRDAKIQTLLEKNIQLAALLEQGLI